ncbi:PTS sugar transporter subunit IIB [Heyndrickxia sporothermodurans]|uniref:PTS system mannose/fructose/N-acetylgalactosamine-transporter subunit IIB n=1 Tax=Heyndrickxia sporothermodurans TaxID=46224 RepID=UPI002DB5A1FD|nr:PTS sugar transporter subunit IIB [Heyndrickxia sporothermodurans]MEB6551352.1 PTS sugar transporter subunit IIB [Heyndrickxia sporothermodurans]
MTIAVTRIDERLIHGQVAYSWSVEYQVSSIVVIDNQLATDETQKLLLGLAVPAGKKHAVLNVDDAIKYIEENENKERIFIVVKSPSTLVQLVNNGGKLTSINVGGMYYKPGKKEISKTVYIDDQDREDFLALKEHGIECEIRTSPKDKSKNLFDFI